MGSWWGPRRSTESRAAESRSTEGILDSLAATGAWGGGYDPVDPDDYGYRKLGSGRRDAPSFTLSKAKSLSVHSYRANPMARAIIDTYTSFIVGDSGLTLHTMHPDVQPIAERFWRDPRNALADMDRQELLLRSHMLMGETALEMLVGGSTGVTRFSSIDPDAIIRVSTERGNPLWPGKITVKAGGVDELTLDAVSIDDVTGLRAGDILFRASWKALAWDTRGWPFLAPILDWLESYDQVLWNLIDRTAVMRYVAFDVTVDGDQAAVNEFIKARGGQHAPRSGSVEVHNDKVTWKPLSPQVGAYEDKVTGQSVLTNIAAGSGLAKTWLAEPEDANRATSLTMAEPVRRRVGGLQNVWLDLNAELVRYAVDQAAARGRVDREVEVKSEDGNSRRMPAAECVKVAGPEIAASDAKVNAEILVNLAQALTGMKAAGLMADEASKIAVRKAWEDYVGLPWRPELDDKVAAAAEDGDSNELATVIDEIDSERRRALNLA